MRNSKLFVFQKKVLSKSVGVFIKNNFLILRVLLTFTSYKYMCEFFIVPTSKIDLIQDPHKVRTFETDTYFI